MLILLLWLLVRALPKRAKRPGQYRQSESPFSFDITLPWPRESWPWAREPRDRWDRDDQDSDGSGGDAD